MPNLSFLPSQLITTGGEASGVLANPRGPHRVGCATADGSCRDVGRRPHDMALVPTQMLSQQHLLRTGASEKTRRRDVEHVFTFHSHLQQLLRRDLHSDVHRPDSRRKSARADARQLPACAYFVYWPMIRRPRTSMHPPTCAGRNLDTWGFDIRRQQSRISMPARPNDRSAHNMHIGAIRELFKHIYIP